MCLEWKAKGYGEPIRRGCVAKEYEEAIRHGCVVIEATKLTFSGVPGSGKTTLRSLILDECLPEKRTSTPVATKATQATIVALDQEKWHAVDGNKITEMILDEIEDKGYEKVQDDHSSTQIELCVPASEEQSSHNDVKSESNKSSIRQRLRTILRDHQHRRKGKMQLKKMIYLVDIGGQPELQEVAPLVVRNASVNLLVLKLCDELQAKPDNEWYDDGNCITEPKKMALTNKQYIVQAARSVFLSKPKLKIKQAISVPEKPSVVLVGTHRDLETVCPESCEEKERELKDEPIFKKHLKENHITCIRGHLILDIDGSVSGHASKENLFKLKKLRNALLTHSSKLKVKIPLAWYLLLLDIQSESVNNHFISLEKSYQLGSEWEISQESVEAALQFFDELNMILYYPSSCKNVVFCNPDFLLQKLTDMIVTSVSVPDVDDKVGLRATFREQGIFTRELFQTPKFLEGFNDLFSLDDFLCLLQHLPIIAQISIDPKKQEYFMPCVLPFEVSTTSVSVVHDVDPLIIIFPSGCSPSGVFCATIVHLIKSKGDDELKWVVTSSEHFKRKRNVIEFQIMLCTSNVKAHFDNTVGTVIFEDASSHFVIQTTCDRKYCYQLYTMLSSALENAIEDLSYDADRIDYVVGVQCTTCTGTEAHVASIGPDNKWRCERKHTRNDLSARQSPWFIEDLQNEGKISRTEHISRLVPPCDL